MGNFRRDDRSGGDRGFGRRSFGGNNRGGDREMFKATCSNCGKSCEVPFRPTGSKPVYCSDCFREMGGGKDRDGGRPERSGGGRSYDNRSQGRDDRRDAPRPSQDHPQYKEQFEALNLKLDKILKMLSLNEAGTTSVSNKEEVVYSKAYEKPIVEAESEEQELKLEESAPVVVKKKRVAKKAVKATEEE